MKVNLLDDFIVSSNKIVILSGAGVSTASGVPDFRSNTGIYNNRDVIKFLSRDYYNKDKVSFWKHFKIIFQDLLYDSFDINVCHSLVTKLLNLGKEVTVVTQNIDGLYSKVIDNNLYELHGNLNSFSCSKECEIYDKSYILKHEVPKCEFCDEILNSNVVLFGDEVRNFNNAISEIYDSDLLLVMGTSLEVFPVNSLIRYNDNMTKILINKDITLKEHHFDLVINDDLSNVLSNLSFM